MHYPTFLKERQQSLTAFLHAALVLDPTVEEGFSYVFMTSKIRSLEFKWMILDSRLGSTPFQQRN